LIEFRKLNWIIWALFINTGLIRAKNSAPNDSLHIHHEQIVDAKGVFKKKVINNDFYRIAKLGVDSIILTRLNLEDRVEVNMHFEMNNAGEFANAFDFSIIQDSFLVILTTNRNKLIFYNLNRDLKRIKEVPIDVDSIYYFNYLETINTDLLLVYRAQEFNDIKLCKSTFAVVKVEFGDNPSFKLITSIYDEDCLLYQMNSMNKTWSINSKYLYYSNGCSGKILIYSMLDGKLSNEIVVFENEKIEQTKSEVKKIGLKYRLNSSYKLLNDIDEFYFSRPNIYMIGCTEDQLLIISSDSCFNKNKHFDVSDLSEFKNNLDYKVLLIKDVQPIENWNISNLMSNLSLVTKRSIGWNYLEIAITDYGLFGWNSICDDYLSFSNNLCKLRLTHYQFK
jgi:hypothetical protein